MTTATNAANVFYNFLVANGQTVKIQNYSKSFSGADYDIAINAESGTVISTPALVQAVSSDSKDYVERGVLQQGLKKLFMASGVDLSENAVVVFGAGSWYAVPDSLKIYSLQGQAIWKMLTVKQTDV
jgi:hypothetical protein